MALSGLLLTENNNPVFDKFKEPLKQLMKMSNVKDIETLFDGKEIDSDGGYATIFTIGGGEYILRLESLTNSKYANSLHADKLVNHNAKHLAKVYFYGEFEKYETSIVIMEKLEKNEDTRIVEDIQIILNETYRNSDKFDFIYNSIPNDNSDAIIKYGLKQLIHYTVKSRNDMWGGGYKFRVIDKELSSKDLDAVKQIFTALLEYKTLTGFKYADFHAGNVMKKGSTYKLIDL